MEWNRAKSILIISFLCLNILLAYQLWINKNNPAGAHFGMNEMKEETLQLMRNHGIELDTVIPTETPTLSEIAVQFVEEYDENEVIQLSAPIQYNILMNNGQLEDILTSEIPQAELYQWDPILSHDEIVLNQLYQELPLFEIVLTLYNNEQSIYAYSQSIVEVEPSSTEKEQRILHAYKAVAALSEYYLQAGAVIVDVSLGYYGQNYNSETQVLAPQWRIVIDNGDIYYVNGINGEVTPSQKE